MTEQKIGNMNKEERNMEIMELSDKDNFQKLRFLKIDKIITIEGVGIIQVEKDIASDNNMGSPSIARSNKEDSTDITIDNEIVVAENMKERDILLSRCTFKISSLEGEQNNKIYINKLKRMFD